MVKVMWLFIIKRKQITWPFPFWEKIVWLDREFSWHQNIYKQVSSKLASSLRITYVNNEHMRVCKFLNFLFWKKMIWLDAEFSWHQEYHNHMTQNPLMRIIYANNTNKGLCKILFKSMHCLIGLPPSILSLALYSMPSQTLILCNNPIWGQKIILI